MELTKLEQLEGLISNELVFIKQQQVALKTCVNNFYLRVNKNPAYVLNRTTNDVLRLLGVSIDYDHIWFTCQDANAQYKQVRLEDLDFNFLTYEHPQIQH
jgi:hypothetical protein